jgi:hypothetical protein
MFATLEHGPAMIAFVSRAFDIAVVVLIFTALT